MKHFTQTANGLCTPPCGSSQGNLSSFRFRNSLLMLFLLLIVGTNAAWGRTPTIFGEGLPGLNTCSDCGDWNNNSKVMQSMGEDGYWYAEFLNVPATENNKYRFKIAINDGTWWDGAMNSGNTNESMGNVDIVNGKGGDNQISFKMPFDGDVYIFYKSTNADNSKVWIVAVPSNIAAPPTGQSQPGYDSGRTLKTDLIFKSNRTGWGAGIKFTRSFATTYKHVTSYILPAKKNAETGNIRFQMLYGDNEYINGKSTPAQLSTSTPRRIIYMWNGDNNGSWIAYTLPTYPVRKSGWKLFVKDYNSGNPTTMDANGSATLTLNGGSSYEFFIANTDYATNISNYSSDICSTPAVHSVNCFGGCYIDESNSSNVTFSEQQVYQSSSCGTLVKSVVAAQDLRGRFTVSGSGQKDVTFTFDGGKITINAVDHVEAFSGDFYVYGAGSNAQNWVTGWSSTDQGGGKANPANHMTITNSVARKTYYSVKGDNLEFKVSDGTNDVGTWSNYSTSKQNGVSASANNQNIRFSLSNASDVTVCYDGTDVWLEVKERQKPNDAWRVTGTFNSWSQNDAQMSDDATNRCKKVTLTNVTKAYDRNGHGWIKFKIFKGTDWGENIHHDNATIIGLDGTQIGTVADDNEGDDRRILVQVDEASDITFCYYTYSDGTNIVTIKRTAYVAPVVSGIDYDGTEYIFMDRRQMGFSDNIAMSDATCWIEFSNGSESAGTQYAAFMSDDNTLASLAPAGTWTKVRVARGGQDAFTTEWGTSGWLDIDTKEKNYITQNIGGWSTYTFPNSRFFVATPQDINNPTGSWNWNGDGTLRTNSYTKTLAANELFIFKLTRDYTRARANVRWSMEGNYTHYNSSSSNLSNTECSNINNNQIKVQLDHKADVTISWLNYGDIIITQVPYYNVTFDSDGGSAMAAQELRSGEYATDPGTPSRGSGYTFNFWKLSGESSAYDFSTPVTSDIELVADWTAPTLYTVTFDSNGGSEVDAQEVVENETATAPADPTRDNYTFGGWKLGNVFYNFSTPVTGNIELVADWTYAPAHISSVSINESSIYTWEGDAITYTLIPTLVPGDIASVTVSWSSSDNNVATVVNGVITPQGRPGTATITCTATDYYSGSQTATCAVKVAPCAKALADAPSYSVTITGYNSYEDGDATLTGLWNSSEPENITVYHLTVTPNSGGKRYLYADASDNYVKRNTSSSAAEADNYYWIRTNVGTTGSSLQIFTLQNYGILKNEGTNAFLSSASSNAITTNWGAHRAIVQEDGTANVAKWHFIDGCGAKMMNMAFSNGDNNYSTHETFLHVDTELGYGDIGMTMSDESIVAVGSSDNCQDRSAHRPALEGAKSVPNPAYIPSQMNSSYYRMKENATVQANLGSALAEADVISVELYADAATSVTLCKTNGDVVATINLNADAATEYSYLVTAGTMLDGESAFIIKAADNHAGIRSIAVTPMVTESPAQPDLHWTTTPVTAHLLLDGNFTYTAASSDSEGAISYASEDINVAQVDASTGEVTPSGAGTTNITATIAADECHATRTISYEVSFLGLQDYINTDGVNSVTLPGDYTSENIVINKPFTINGAGHAIGNLTVEMAGDLTLSGALTVNDFSIYAKAGNTTTPAASGQVRNATNLTANGNAYFYYTVDPSGTVHFGWYDFTVPFPVDVMTGIAGIEDEVLNEDFVNERNYAIMEHLGEKQAAGQYAYKKFRGIMEPCRLYSITLDDDYNYNTIRFKKADGALAAGNEVTLNAYAGEAKHANWNGVGNGTLHHADVEVSTVGYIQVYQSGTKTFLPVDRGQYSLVVGSAFMIQQAGTMTLNQATHDKLLAPRRAASVQPTAIQIASEGKPFSDQLFISADETAGQGYTQGVDVAKAGNIGNVNVPQIWTNAYDSKLCAHEAQLINGQAAYALSLYAPANGTYTLTSKNIPEGYTLYLTQNGNKIWDMSDAYVIDLTKGTTNEYGLLLVERYNAPTGIENGEWTNGEAQKVLRNGVLYIIRNGEVFNAQGAVMK